MTRFESITIRKSSLPISKLSMRINSTRKRSGWQHSSVKTQRARWLSTPIGIRLHSSQNITRTIAAEGQVAGHIACYPDGEKLEVTYWLGREFWGRGLATQALKRILHLTVDRPIFARAATDNVGSIRVLQKCGFEIIGKNKDFANGRGEDTEEYILRLDLDQTNE